MPTWQEQTRAGVRHLRRRDPVLRAVIDQVGPFRLKPDRDRFGMLVRSIIAQQISTAAARTIRNRLLERLAPHGLTADGLLTVPPAELRGLGLSARKAEYVLDLAGAVASGRLDLPRIGRLADEAVIEQLVAVRGIGRWTAQMFLIFSLGRLNVFPEADLGIRRAIEQLYGPRVFSVPDERQSIVAAWQPWSTIACWYCWRTLDAPLPGTA